MTATINTTATPEARAAAVSSFRSQGDRYGHAGIAGLAHELAVRLEGDKLPNGVAAKLVDSTGYDKGTVSRVSKIVRTDKKARTSAIKFDVMTASDSESSFDAAVKVGLLFKRQPAKASTRVKTEADPIADVYAWLIASTDDAQYEARKSLVADMLARIDDERAALAAAEDSEDLAA
jgi:hypothetical protein